MGSLRRLFRFSAVTSLRDVSVKTRNNKWPSNIAKNCIKKTDRELVLDRLRTGFPLPTPPEKSWKVLFFFLKFRGPGKS